LRSFALASGSSGNCFCIELDGNAYLVDVGLSFSKTKEILEEKGIDIYHIRGIFITHEHSDHVLGFKQFFNKLNCNFYMSKGTFDGLKINSDEKIMFVSHHSLITLENMRVFVLEKPHDAREALSYVFENGKKIGIFTDLGHVTDEIIHVMKTLDVLYIEANYCQKYVRTQCKDMNINYLNRLMSDVGHLGLHQTIDTLKKVCYDGQRIILSHISENTNYYENVYIAVKNMLNELEVMADVILSFQKEPTIWVE
jgi:phosphoribosyl 1,2-cyclic phosphodiesterase